MTDSFNDSCMAQAEGTRFNMARPHEGTFNGGESPEERALRINAYAEGFDRDAGRMRQVCAIVAFWCGAQPAPPRPACCDGLRVLSACATATYPCRPCGLPCLALPLHHRYGGATDSSQAMEGHQANGARDAALGRVKLPAVVVHGIDDKLIPVVGGLDTAQACT